MTILDDIRRHFHVDNFYDVLKIPIYSTQSEIKKAYFQRSLELHPDKAKDSNDQEDFKQKFQIISKVYQILSNDSSKEEYDKQYHFESSQDVVNVTNSTVHEEVPITSCSKQNGVYSYDCRCSGQFILDDCYLNSSSYPDNCSSPRAFIIDCDTCSNSIKITL